MLRRLSASAELVLINLLCFGPFVVLSVVGLAARETVLVFDDRDALRIVVIEVVCGAIAALLLRARGWTLQDLGLRISLPQTIGGMLLLIGSLLLISTFYEVVRYATGMEPDAITASQTKLTWPVLIALTLANPLYDEVFLVAYNVRAAESHGPAFAITLSAAIRFLCHLEQGPMAAMAILPLGILFATIYWRWRLVWPLVVAHGVMDFMGMMPETTLLS